MKASGSGMVPSVSSRQDLRTPPRKSRSLCKMTEITSNTNRQTLMSTSNYSASETNHSRTPTSHRAKELQSLLKCAVPVENGKAYALLYAMENALRMLIVEQLETVAGPRWYNQRLPGDVLASYRTARGEERRIRWTKLVPHHPIYYVDFPSLRKIIEQKNNWNDAFGMIFGRKDIFASSWSTVEPIRNKVAHSRQIGQTDVITLMNTFNFLSHSIGENQFNELACRSRAIPDIIQRINTLRDEGKMAIRKCKQLATIESLRTWKIISNSWWFDESYIGHDLSPTQRYFETLERYLSLPRNRGRGHLIEKWVREKNLDRLFLHSDNSLAKLVRE